MQKRILLMIMSALLAIAVAVTASAAVVTTPKTASEILLGDADGNGKIDISDATVVQRHTADLLTLTDDCATAADVDGDNRISIGDATEIQKFIAEFTVNYAIGQPVDSTAQSTEPDAQLTSGNSGTEMPRIKPGETAVRNSEYTDESGDSVVIPTQFRVSSKEDEQTISEGLVVIGPDESEFVWVPTTVTPFERYDFGSYFFANSTFSGFYDETDLESYQKMAASVDKYGGFYMGRYEASQGENNVPVSKRISNSGDGHIWVQFSPQDTTVACQKMYADNDAVQGFFPWGVNWDTTLQWLIDSGCKTEFEVTMDSTSWGNYSDDAFSQGARGNATGIWEEAKANNIYDLAGNNWEWTQERHGSGNYVMRGGGYNLMGGACPGSKYPAALRDPLPGNNHHPNVTFRPALYIK